MVKTFDLIAINTIIMLLTFIWTYYIVKNIWYAIAISIAIYLLVWSVIKILKKKKKTTYNSQKLAKHFAILGSDYSLNFIFDNINSADKEIINNKYILLKNSLEIIYPMYKFGNIGYENIAQIYRLAKENNYKKVYLLYSNIDRNAMVLANALNIKFEFVNIDYIFNYLKKSNKLPDLVEFSEKPFTKLSIKMLANIIISRKNTKYYVFTGVLFALISFITPLQSYYVTVSTISFVLAIITMLPIKFNMQTNIDTIENSKSFDKLLLKTKNNINNEKLQENFFDNIENKKNNNKTNEKKPKKSETKEITYINENQNKTKN